MPMCMDIPKVAPRESRSGTPGVTPRSWPDPSISVCRAGVGQQVEDRRGGAGTTRSPRHVAVHGQSPGLDCMIPPSAKMVVAVM